MKNFTQINFWNIKSVQILQEITQKSFQSSSTSSRWQKVNESWSGNRTDASRTAPRVTVYPTMNLWFLHFFHLLVFVMTYEWSVGGKAPSHALAFRPATTWQHLKQLHAPFKLSTNLGSRIKSSTPHTPRLITRHATEIFVRLTWSEIDPSVGSCCCRSEIRRIVN